MRQTCATIVPNAPMILVGTRKPRKTYLSRAFLRRSCATPTLNPKPSTLNPSNSVSTHPGHPAHRRGVHYVRRPPHCRGGCGNRLSPNNLLRLALQECSPEVQCPPNQGVYLEFRHHWGYVSFLASGLPRMATKLKTLKPSTPKKNL